jgi:chitinase
MHTQYIVHPSCSALSFLLLEGAWDKVRHLPNVLASVVFNQYSTLFSQAYEWTTLTADQRSSIKSQYAAAGIKLIVSVFGSTDVPTTMNADPVATANTMAAWVKQYDLDGIDVDYEDFNAFDTGNGSAEVRSFPSSGRI